MLLGHYLALLLNSERSLDTAYRRVGEQHAAEADIQTITAWDPVSKQPLFKVAAVAVTKLGTDDGTPGGEG